MAWYAAHASSTGGAMLFRVPAPESITAALMRAAPASGYSDQSSAIAPVTNGAAALVPPMVYGLPSVPRLVTFSPGALTPRRPMEQPRLESPSGRPCRLQAATGI